MAKVGGKSWRQKVWGKPEWILCELEKSLYYREPDFEDWGKLNWSMWSNCPSPPWAENLQFALPGFLPLDVELLGSVGCHIDCMGVWCKRSNWYKDGIRWRSHRSLIRSTGMAALVTLTMCCDFLIYFQNSELQQLETKLVCNDFLELHSFTDC